MSAITGDKKQLAVLAIGIQKCREVADSAMTAEIQSRVHNVAKKNVEVLKTAGGIDVHDVDDLAVQEAALKKQGEDVMEAMVLGSQHIGASTGEVDAFLAENDSSPASPVAVAPVAPPYVPQPVPMPARGASPPKAAAPAVAAFAEYEA